MSPVQIGESFVGKGADAAHVNTVLGDRSGPVGTAWATALATPSAGHVPYMVVLRPGLPVQPPTLFVTKAAPVSEDHGRMIWGPAQAGVAAGVLDALADGVVDPALAATGVLIAAVWVNPAAADADAIYRHNREATAASLHHGARALPTVADVLAAREQVSNPFYTPPS